MKTILITEAALMAASHPEFPVRELMAGNPPSTFANVTIRVGEDAVLVATEVCDLCSRLLVVGSGVSRHLASLRPEEYAPFFERSVRFGLRSFDKGIALSPSAMAYRQGARSSVFASNGSTLRILAEEGYGASRNVYVYDLEEAANVQDLAEHDPDPAPYGRALLTLPALFAQPLAATLDEDSVELDWHATGPVAKGFAYDEWLPLLSKEQQVFVTQRKIQGPLRVRGAAGTGKTLAMVMKALTVAKQAGENPARILFLTHSWAMASQVDEMIRSIGRDIPGASLIDVYPLLELARQRDYTLVGRQPLGLDSETGITETLKVISELIDVFVSGDWVAFRGGCSVPFTLRMEEHSSI